MKWSGAGLIAARVGGSGRNGETGSVTVGRRLDGVIDG